ncbi:hypothetical protein HanIR_Chr06g0276951 [Helianthus annuus]|nr:hypothetical protein HanIR_Chr06g0276951 [Helianthus annuus]
MRELDHFMLSTRLTASISRSSDALIISTAVWFHPNFWDLKDIENLLHSLYHHHTH